MRDIDVFAKLLDLERPWLVDDVILDPDAQTVDIRLRHRSNGRFRCLQCGAELPVHDHRSTRWAG